MKNRNYPGAVNACKEALRLMPGDRTATAELAEAMKLLAAQTTAAYQSWMKQGQAALNAKRWADAVKAFDQALKLRPGDGEAIKGKKAASDALNAPKPPPVNPLAEYNKAMQRAQALEKQRKYAEAVAAYREALKWVAGDAKQVTNQGNAWLGVARNEHAARRYAEAVKAYEEVLKRIPNQPEARAALPRAKANKP
jgi:tetratricopeptide (TPR) repeat protein